MFFPLPLTLLLAIEASAQVASDIQLSGSVTTGTSLSNLGGDLLPTGSDVSYLSYTTTSTLNGTTAIFQTTMAVANASSSSTSKHSTSTSVTLLQGSMRSSSTSSNATMTGNSTASRTSTLTLPTNTQVRTFRNYFFLFDCKVEIICHLVGADSSYALADYLITLVKRHVMSFVLIQKRRIPRLLPRETNADFEMCVGMQ